MIRQRYTIKFTLFLVALLFIAQGCLGKKETVQLIPAPENPVTCSQALSKGIDEISNADLALIMDQAFNEEDLSCWKRLVKTALEQDSYIPMRHLAKAVHAFNANESENEFSLSIHRYFLEITRGKGTYQGKDQNLMKAYVSFEIKRSQTKNDDRLKKAKLVCKRLDNDLYRKFFL